MSNMIFHELDEFNYYHYDFDSYSHKKRTSNVAYLIACDTINQLDIAVVVHRGEGYPETDSGVWFLSNYISGKFISSINRHEINNIFGRNYSEDVNDLELWVENQLKYIKDRSDVKYSTGSDIINNVSILENIL